MNYIKATASLVIATAIATSCAVFVIERHFRNSKSEMAFSQQVPSGEIIGNWDTPGAGMSFSFKTNSTYEFYRWSNDGSGSFTMHKGKYEYWDKNSVILKEEGREPIKFVISRPTTNRLDLIGASTNDFLTLKTTAYDLEDRANGIEGRWYWHLNGTNSQTWIFQNGKFLLDYFHHQFPIFGFQEPGVWHDASSNCQHGTYCVQGTNLWMTYDGNTNRYHSTFYLPEPAVLRLNIGKENIDLDRDYPGKR